METEFTKLYCTRSTTEIHHINYYEVVYDNASVGTAILLCDSDSLLIVASFRIHLYYLTNFGAHK